MMFIHLCNIYDTHPIFQDPLKYFCFYIKVNSEVNEGLPYLTCMQLSYSKTHVKKKRLCSFKKRSGHSDNIPNFLLPFLV